MLKQDGLIHGLHSNGTHDLLSLQKYQNLVLFTDPALDGGGGDPASSRLGGVPHPALDMGRPWPGPDWEVPHPTLDGGGGVTLARSR